MANQNDDDEDELKNPPPPPGISIDQTQLTPQQVAAARMNPNQTPPKTLDELEAQSGADVNNQLGTVFKGSPFQSPLQPSPAVAPAPINSGRGINMGGGNPTPPAPAVDPYAQAQQNAANETINNIKGIGAGYSQIGELEKQRDANDARIRLQNNTDMADAAAKHQENLNKFKTETDLLLKDFNNGHINPNRFMESKSVPQKISTAIGLMLSSIGSGMLHRENPVMKWLNSQVERDIESQKQNINSIYSHYRDKTGDSYQALALARSMAYQNLANQVDANRDKYNGPIAQQNSDIMKLQFQNMANAAQQQGANRATLQSTIMKAQRGEELNPMEVSQLPKEQRDQYVPGHGFALSSGDAQKFKEDVLPAADAIQHSITELTALSKKPLSSWNVDDKQKAALLTTELKGHLAKGIYSKTTRSEIEQLGESIKNPTDILGMSGARLAALQQAADDNLATVKSKAKSIGLDPNTFRYEPFVPQGK